MRIGMRRKASFAVNSELLTRKATQRIARARIQTMAGIFAEDPLGSSPVGVWYFDWVELSCDFVNKRQDYKFIVLSFSGHQGLQRPRKTAANQRHRPEPVLFAMRR
jgi:hypothetical protein